MPLCCIMTHRSCRKQGGTANNANQPASFSVRQDSLKNSFIVGFRPCNFAKLLKAQKIYIAHEIS